VAWFTCSLSMFVGCCVCVVVCVSGTCVLPVCVCTSKGHSHCRGWVHQLAVHMVQQHVMCTLEGACMCLSQGGGGGGCLKVLRREGRLKASESLRKQHMPAFAWLVVCMVGREVRSALHAEAAMVMAPLAVSGVQATRCSLQYSPLQYTCTCRQHCGSRPDPLAWRSDSLLAGLVCCLGWGP
jgi:hypothetical protein